MFPLLFPVGFAENIAQLQFGGVEFNAKMYVKS